MLSRVRPSFVRVTPVYSRTPCGTAAPAGPPAGTSPRFMERGAFQPVVAPAPLRGLRQVHAQSTSGAGSTGRSDGNPFGDGFAGRLLLATGREHGALSKHPRIAQLKGPQSAAPYAQLLHDKLVLYAALEELLPQQAHNPVVAALLTVPHLARVPRLEADLAALGRPGAPSTAAQAYVTHLRELAATRPAALAIHAWLSYLAEMFGGQGLQRALLMPHGADAVTSFGFAAPLAELMPRAINCLEPAITSDCEAALIDEARAAYAWSRRLFDAAAAAL